MLVAGYLFIPAFTAKWSRNAVCRVGQLSVLSPDATATYEHFTELIRRYEIIWGDFGRTIILYISVWCSAIRMRDQQECQAGPSCCVVAAWRGAQFVYTVAKCSKRDRKRKKDTGEKGKGKQGELQLKEERMC